jgi:hypothetical protein
MQTLEGEKRLNRWGCNFIKVFWKNTLGKGGSNVKSFVRSRQNLVDSGKKGTTLEGSYVKENGESDDIGGWQVALGSSACPVRYCSWYC